MMNLINEIREMVVRNEQSDLALGFDKLFEFIAANPESETARRFAEYHLENHEDEVTAQGKPSFAYLIGQEFSAADWVAEEDMEAFIKMADDSLGKF